MSEEQKNGTNEDSKVIYRCKNCERTISENDKICPHCEEDVVGRDISITLGDYLKLSDEQKNQISTKIVKWDPNGLSFLGIFFTMFLGIISVLRTIPRVKISINYQWNNNFVITFTLSLITTLIFLLAVTKVKLIRGFLIKFINWLLKDY